MYVDGTFEHCTKLFCILYVQSMAFFDNLFINTYLQYIFLLIDEQTITYDDPFKAIDSECLNVSQDFKIDSIYVDFGESILRAIQTIWPEIHKSM